MPEPEDIQQQQRLLQTNRRTLTHYLEQYAKHTSAYAPPNVVHGIEEARDNIQAIKRALRQWGVEVEDLPSDEAADPRHKTQSSQQLPLPPEQRPPAPRLPPPAQAVIGALDLHMISDGTQWAVTVANRSDREITQVNLRFRAPPGVFANPLAARAQHIAPAAREQAGKMMIGKSNHQSITFQVSASYWLSGLAQPERTEGTITVSLA